MIIIYVLLIILIYPVMYSNFGIYNNKKNADPVCWHVFVKKTGAE